MKSQKIRKVLKSALKKGDALRFRQWQNDANQYGFPVGIGEEWVLFHVIAPDVMTLNGYRAVRIDDIEKARTDPDFLVRALSALGERAIAQPDILLSDVPSLLESANERFPLLNLYLEDRGADRCYVGRIERTGKSAVRLWKISSKARWQDNPAKFPYEDITAVEFGDGYTNALWVLGQKEWLARNEIRRDDRNA